MTINLTWKVCRICLWEGDELQSIFEKDEEDRLLSEKIITCGGIAIDRNTNLPEQICRKCIAFLNVAYKFYVNCQNSDRILKTFISDIKIDEVTNLPRKFTEFATLSIPQVAERSTTESNEKEECITIQVLKVQNKPLEDYEQENKNAEDLDCNNVANKSPPQEKIIQMETEDERGDSWFSPEQLSSDTDVQESKPITTMETRRKSTRRKPQNTLTVMSDGSALLTSVPEEKPLHICEVCGNKYTKKCTLDNHMKWHRDEKPLCCEICGKKFSINFQLTRHMRSHTGQKPYQCKFCGRKFSDLSTCIKHQRTHTDERPFKCETCGKAFNYSHVLKVHMTVHTGEKPYRCDLCGKSFSQLHHLKAHLNTLIHQSNSPREKANNAPQIIQTESSKNLQSIIAMLDNDPDIE